MTTATEIKTTITVKKSILQKALGVVSKAVGSKSTIPIVAYVLFKSNPNKTVSLAATDLDVSIIATFAGFEFDNDFAAAIEYKKLNDLISKLLPDDTLTITITDKNSTVDIKCRSYKFKLRSQPASEFPSITTPSGSGIPIPTGMLVKAITSTAYAASTENIKPALTGMNIEIGPDLNITTTDSHRLATFHGDINHEGDPQKFLIPVKAMSELARLAEIINPTNVTFHKVDRHIVFELNGQILSSRMIDANYPNWRGIIRPEIEGKIQIKKNVLLNEIETVSTMGSPVIHLSFSKEKLKITARNEDDNSTAETDIDIVYAGPDLSLMFNVKYLKEAIKNSDFEVINIDIINTETPMILFPATPDEYKAIIMPIKP